MLLAYLLTPIAIIYLTERHREDDTGRRVWTLFASGFLSGRGRNTMCCRKFRIISLLSILGLTSFAAQADMVDDYTNNLRFNKVRSNCLDSSAVVFPCVSLPPSSYTPSYPTKTPSALSSNSVEPAGDVEELLQPHLFTLPMKYKEAIKSQWRALHLVLGLVLNFKLVCVGVGLFVVLGGLVLFLFVFVGEEQLLVFGVFLGF